MPRGPTEAQIRVQWETDWEHTLILGCLPGEPSACYEKVLTARNSVHELSISSDPAQGPVPTAAISGPWLRL